MLYKEEKDIKYKAAFKELPDGNIEILFTCDGGKFGTDEQLAEYHISPKELMRILGKYLDHSNKKDGQ